MSIQNLYPNISPSLSLDFAAVQQLDPRISFSRASTATYYGTQTAKAEENLFIRSQDFAFGTSSVTGWNKLRSTAGSAVTAPDGTTTAEPITQATGQTNSGGVLQTVSAVLSTYVASVFAKPNGKNFLRFNEDLGTGSSRISWIDLSTGTAGTTNAGHTVTITASTEGFYRVSVVFTVNATRSAGIFFSLADTDNSSTVTDSGGLILWGAQFEQRSAVTAYTATTTQPITNYVPQLLTAASGVARFDHNPITDESLGLLIEEQRTNLRTYSEDFTNAVWTKSGASIAADTVIAPDGTLTGDKLVENTATSRHFVTTTLTLTANTVYTLSVYMKAGERTTASFGNSSTANWVGGVAIVVNLATGVITSGTGTIQSVGNGWYRVSGTGTFGPANANGGMLIDLQTTAGYTGDGYSGIYIWGAQLEAGAFPTSYIQTVASQVTRAADAASMTGANFSSWYRADEGTFYTEANKPAALASAIVFSANDNSSNNRQSFVYVSATSLRYRSITNNVNDGSITATVGADSYVKSAGAYKVNDFAYSANAGSAGADTSALVPVVSQLNIGSEFTASIYLNGTIRKIAYYPLRVSNTNLVALTS